MTAKLNHDSHRVKGIVTGKESDTSSNRALTAWCPQWCVGEGGRIAPQVVEVLWSQDILTLVCAYVRTSKNDDRTQRERKIAMKAKGRAEDSSHSTRQQPRELKEAWRQGWGQMKRGAMSSASLPRMRLMESGVVYTQSSLHIQTSGMVDPHGRLGCNFTMATKVTPRAAEAGWQWKP